MFKWIKPYYGWMILSCIIMLFASVISLLSPYLTRMAIDKAIPEKNYKLLIILSIILFASLSTHRTVPCVHSYTPLVETAFVKRLIMNLVFAIQHQ